VGTVAAYIDGLNLYYNMRARYGHRHLWLDVVGLVRQLRASDRVVVVRYFTAIVKNEPAAAQNQDDYIQAMKARNGPMLDVRLGRFKDRSLRSCHRCGEMYICGCGREYRSYEEKETDVGLGAMMVADAARHVAGSTLLISADSDLAPALEAVRMVVPDQRIFVALPPGNPTASRHLTRVGRVNQFPITGTALRDAQLPEVMHDPETGRTLVRPAKWR
jgi:hypothetical protein